VVLLKADKLMVESLRKARILCIRCNFIYHPVLRSSAEITVPLNHRESILSIAYGSKPLKMRL
jgi:hypothetical protein